MSNVQHSFIPEPATAAVAVSGLDPVYADPRTQAALAAIARSDRTARGEAAGVGLVASAFATAVEQEPLARAVRIAQGVCIVATGFVPVALFWSLVWPG